MSDGVDFVQFFFVLTTPVFPWPPSPFPNMPKASLYSWVILFLIFLPYETYLVRFSFGGCELGLKVSVLVSCGLSHCWRK